MKKTNSAFVFGALVVASFAAVRCGGDDSNSATTTSSGGSAVNTGGGAGSANAGADNGGTANTGGTATGAGGANTGGANNGGANNGGANNGGANNGGSANPTDGGGGTAVGAGGTQVAGDAGMCPAMAPMNNAMCTGNVTCDYPSNMPNFVRACVCRASGARNDAGERAREFTCGNVFVPPARDAGATGDAGTGRCANGTSDGDNCNMPGEVCRLGNNGGCACITLGNQTQWFCN